MTNLTATEARKQLYNLLAEVAESHAPVQIAGRRHAAVLVSEADWRAIQETLYLTGIPGMRESIVKGLKTPVQKCKPELRSLIGEMEARVYQSGATRRKETGAIRS